MAESLCCSPEIKSCFFFFLKSMHHKGAAAWEMKSCRASLLGSSAAETHRMVKSPEGSRWLQGCGAPHRALFPNSGALLTAWGELALICPLAVDGEFPPTGKSCLTQEVISKGSRATHHRLMEAWVQQPNPLVSRKANQCCLFGLRAFLDQGRDETYPRLPPCSVLSSSFSVLSVLYRFLPQ